MEHRYSRRIDIDVQVLIYKFGLPVVMGRARNMSKHGMFIECVADDFSLHQTLEIELFLQGAQSYGSSRFKCLLARKEKHGVALAIFDDFQRKYATHANHIALKLESSAGAGI